jgi:hypothetical protein
MLWYFWRYIYSSPINVFYKCIFNINLLDVMKKKKQKTGCVNTFCTHCISSGSQRNSALFVSINLLTFERVHYPLLHRTRQNDDGLHWPTTRITVMNQKNRTASRHLVWPEPVCAGQQWADAPSVKVLDLFNCLQPLSCKAEKEGDGWDNDSEGFSLIILFFIFITVRLLQVCGLPIEKHLSVLGIYRLGDVSYTAIQYCTCSLSIAFSAPL